MVLLMLGFIGGPVLAHLYILPAMAGFVLFDLGGLLGASGARIKAFFARLARN